MMILNRLLNNRLSSKVLLRAITIISLVGFADTVYLTANHYLGTGIKCLLLEGCEIVLASPYSQVLGIPMAVIGLVFYVGIFILASMAEIYQNNLLVKFLVLGGTLGFAASLVFLYIQIFIIGALCVYCLVSATSSTIIFIATILLNKNIKISTHDGSSPGQPERIGLVK